MRRHCAIELSASKCLRGRDLKGCKHIPMYIYPPSWFPVRPLGPPASLDFISAIMADARNQQDEPTKVAH